jgi:hypothetical protein
MMAGRRGTGDGWYDVALMVRDYLLADRNPSRRLRTILMASLERLGFDIYSHTAVFAYGFLALQLGLIGRW